MHLWSPSWVGETRRCSWLKDPIQCSPVLHSSSSLSCWVSTFCALGSKRFHPSSSLRSGEPKEKHSPIKLGGFQYFCFPDFVKYNSQYQWQLQCTHGPVWCFTRNNIFNEWFAFALRDCFWPAGFWTCLLSKWEFPGWHMSYEGRYHFRQVDKWHIADPWHVAERTRSTNDTSQTGDTSLSGLVNLKAKRKIKKSLPHG